MALKLDITNNFTKLETAAGNVVNGIDADLDTTNLNILKALSDPTNSTLSAGCSNFNTDSWIPSISASQTTISCKVSSGAGPGTLANCPALTAITCLGCMDTSQIAGNAAYTSKAAFRAELDGNYVSTCAFNPIMANVW